MLASSAVWWAGVNLASAAGMAIRWTLPPSVVHSLLMTFGFMPMFFAGFLFTAGPKWLNRPAVRAQTLLSPLLAQLAGWLVFLLAAHGRDADFGCTLGAIGLSAVTLGWWGMVQRFIALVKSSIVADRVHAKLVAAGALYGVAALCTAVWGLAAGEFLVVRAATLSALWAFIGLVFVAVSHRMIPFFSAAAVPALDAWRPLWLLGCFGAVFAFEATATGLQALAGHAMPAWQAARSAVELLAGAAIISLAVRWGLVQSLRIRLLAMLHLGFSWLGIALLLSGVSQAMEAATGAPSALGLAPLHAYTMGFLGSTMFAMVTRVSCGHGGRSLVADDFVWWLFWLLQLAVVSRVLGAILLGSSVAWGNALVTAAAVGWAGVFATWATRYGHWYGTPRPDGRPG